MFTTANRPFVFVTILAASLFATTLAFAPLYRVAAASSADLAPVPYVFGVE